MKELSIEEKAKQYDEAIERAKKHCADYVVETIFPELKESEDERIRKKVIEVLKLNIKGAESQMQASQGVNRTFEVYACNKVISWLEKQGEQKLFFMKPPLREEVLHQMMQNGIITMSDYLYLINKQAEQKPSNQPSFKVGDYIICRNGEDALYQITDSIPTGYMIKGDYGIIHSVTFEQLANCNATLYIQQNPDWSEEDVEMYKKVETAIDSYYAPFSRDAEEISKWFKDKAFDMYLKALKDK